MYYMNPNQHIRHPYPQQATPFPHPSQPNQMMPHYQHRPQTAPYPYPPNQPFPLDRNPQGIGPLPMIGGQSNPNLQTPNPYGQPKPKQPKGFKLGLPKRNQQQKEGNLQVKSPSFLRQAFTSHDGKFDLGQTIQTVEQVTKAVSEMSPIVQQVSSLFNKK
ncbi:hypothetical protein AJ85_10675 [Alkalihalobacillus alcalophilus ATCC 27647 = CGMCC 1.3604]|uniref:Uncharacterized protein n=1 Tax=Alkalihalobacillus alcalophilus ATCC 27647 = CGMCC 1.3604 TaxID=1218173 RepID=A0A094WKB2_ALKAL|nr:hypothetical protein [Alkalihalobacillus alcalophilus]KGA97256.1 hypothetical protein BALCAV_0211155 [Alkalihalobacillus alcalophilus ATCC 27647 = CGMCC 1.3604]MED1562820.1 hypothetical protein [Alkalihalobacillus alcalophilus]THG90467.1 hypothetical protein AJ85_10675 [Alkalihalobacillus alcalophilus ATCC 27647 = CGMCC 1.3604]